MISFYQSYQNLILAPCPDEKIHYSSLTLKTMDHTSKWVFSASQSLWLQWMAGRMRRHSSEVMQSKPWEARIRIYLENEMHQNWLRFLTWWSLLQIPHGGQMALFQHYNNVLPSQEETVPSIASRLRNSSSVPVIHCETMPVSLPSQPWRHIHHPPSSEILATAFSIMSHWTQSPQSTCHNFPVTLPELSVVGHVFMWNMASSLRKLVTQNPHQP